MKVETCMSRNEGLAAIWTPVTLSLDPGWSTGLVLFNNDGVVMEHLTLDRSQLHLRLGDLRRANLPAVVIVERLPISLTKEMREVYEVVNSTFPPHDDSIVVKRRTYTRVDISPGEWKPMTAKLPVPFKTKSQHEKDAYWMALHWLIKRGFLRRPEVI